MDFFLSLIMCVSLIFCGVTGVSALVLAWKIFSSDDSDYGINHVRTGLAVDKKTNTWVVP